MRYLFLIFFSFLFCLQAQSKSVEINIPEGQSMDFRAIGNSLEVYTLSDLKIGEHYVLRKGTKGELQPVAIEKDGVQITMLDKILVKDIFGYQHFFKLNPVIDMLSLNAKKGDFIKIQAETESANHVKVDAKLLKKFDQDKYKVPADSYLISDMIQSRIKLNWSSPKVNQSYSQIVEFKLLKSGMVIGTKFKKNFKDPRVNIALQEAINNTEFPKLSQNIDVEFRFDYNVNRMNVPDVSEKADPMSLLEMSKQARE